ncbi:hypothetical protein CVT24_009949 [Panaeolus cyanescens]|uniref:F-box domain-containing protein n=1 Tax=Panaeolus cyanescens TaxID=181874 RepID=A0A409X5E9_9AGAR|nr:hypothetical protein CVT24_009949 [Panaeolus cyanescens]
MAPQPQAQTATSFIFEIWDHIASYMARDDLTHLALVSDFHLQVARWHLYRHIVLRNERQATPSALDTILLLLRNPLLQRRIETFTILTPSLGMGGPSAFKNWVERFGVQLFSTLTELRGLHMKRPPCARMRVLERFMSVVSRTCRKLQDLVIEGPSSVNYRSTGTRYTFDNPTYHIPSLRSVKVVGRNTNLGWNIASGVLPHPISNITTLHIHLTLPSQRWLADPTSFSDIFSFRFPYLSTLTVADIPQGAHSATLSIFLNRHPTITHLSLLANDPDRTFSITPEMDALPMLSHLRCSPWMMQWLQVNVTLLSLRGVTSLVLDCGGVGNGSVQLGVGAVTNFPNANANANVNPNAVTHLGAPRIPTLPVLPPLHAAQAPHDPRHLQCVAYKGVDFDI